MAEETVVTENVTPTRQVACQKTDCNKMYKARGTMLAHMRKHHTEPQTSEIESPLGSFPPSNSATVLQFDESDEPATQGNSHGEVNSPKLVSSATYLCDMCETHFKTKEEITQHKIEDHESSDVNGFICTECRKDFDSIEAINRHKNEDHINPLDVEVEVLEEAKEDQDLYDMLESMLNESSIHAEVRDEKINRFKTILAKKNTTIKETLRLVSKMKTELDGLKHDAELRGEVLEKQTKELEDKQKEKEALSKDIRNQKDRNKDILISEKLKKMENDKLKGKNNLYLTEIEKLRENVGSLTKENTDLNIKINVKQDLVRGLKEALGIEEAEEEENVEVVEVNPPSVTMNNDINVQKCNACDKRFRTSSALENHINSKHTEKTCLYCDKVCNNEVELIKHHKECNDIGEANRTCNKCSQIFTRNGIRRHALDCHVPNKEFDCTECEQIFQTENHLKEHEANDHDIQPENQGLYASIGGREIALKAHRAISVM